MNIINRIYPNNQAPIGDPGPPSSKPIPGYFATPLDLYGSPLYYYSIEIARNQFPLIQFIEPAEKNWTNEQWLINWEHILPTLKMLTCLPREDRSIGRGCFKEITDSDTIGIPVYVFSHDKKTFFPLQKQIRLPFITRTFRRYARVYSHPPDPKELSVKNG